MSMSSQTIAKNASMLFASQLLTWMLALVVTIFLPRYLGVEAIGELAIANSIWVIMGALIVFGMDLHLTKIAARDPASISEALGTSLAARLILGFIAYCLVSVYVYNAGFSTKAVELTYIIGGTYIVSAVLSAFAAVISGLERMDVTSITGVVVKVLGTALTLVLILLHADIYLIAGIAILPIVLGCVITGRFLAHHHKIYLRFSPSAIWAMLKGSQQYLFTALVLIAYQQIDTLFIANLVDAKTVGWYSAAMNLFSTLMFVPTVIGTAIFPALSRMHTSDPERLNSVARRGFDLMFVVGVPIGLGVSVMAKPVVQLLYGNQFLESGHVLEILGFVLIFTYLNTFLGQLLVSMERTKGWNIVIFVSVLLTIPLDLVLVPWTHTNLGNGAIGGALSFLFTEASMVLGAVLLMPKGLLTWPNIRTVILAFVCGLLMMGVSSWLRDSFLLVPIAAGAVVYISTILLFRVVPREHLVVLKEIAAKIRARLPGRKPAAASITNS